MKLDRERTRMANERTILAYVRTSLSLLVFGVAVNKFYPPGPFSTGVFIITIFLAVLIILYGIIRFISSIRKI